MNKHKKLMIFILIMAIINSSCTHIKNGTVSNEKDTYKKIYVGVYSNVHYTILKQINDLIKKDGYTIIIKFYDNPEKLLYAVAANDIDAAYGITNSEIDSFCDELNQKFISINTNTFEPLLCFIEPKAYHKLEKPEIMIPQEKVYLTRTVDFLKTQETINFLNSNNKSIREQNFSEDYTLAPYDAKNYLEFLNYRGCVIMTSVLAIETGITSLDKYNYIIETPKNTPKNNTIVAISENKKIDDRIKKIEAAFQSEEIIKFIQEYYLGLIIVLQ